MELARAQIDSNDFPSVGADEQVGAALVDDQRRDRSLRSKLDLVACLLSVRGAEQRSLFADPYHHHAAGIVDRRRNHSGAVACRVRHESDRLARRIHDERLKGANVDRRLAPYRFANGETQSRSATRDHPKDQGRAADARPPRRW